MEQWEIKMKLCINCNEEYFRPKCYSNIQWDKRKYCSPECARKNFSERQRLLWLDEDYRAMQVQQHKRSRPNRLGFPLLKNRGVNNHRWKGGITSLCKKIRGCLEYKQWRNSIFGRDNYTCIECGAKSGNGKAIILNADHCPKAFSEIIQEYKIKTIKQAIKCPKLWDINNGRTLCVDCHRETYNFGVRVNLKYANSC